MLQPLRSISKQALLSLVFLVGVMVFCVTLLGPIAMCALGNFRY